MFCDPGVVMPLIGRDGDGTHAVEVARPGAVNGEGLGVATAAAHLPADRVFTALGDESVPGAGNALGPDRDAEPGRGAELDFQFQSEQCGDAQHAYRFAEH